METPDKIINQFHSHPLSHLGAYFSALLLFIIGFLYLWPFCIISFLIIFFTEIMRRAETFFIMDSGVGREYRFMSTSRKFIGYDKIQDMSVNQSFLQNIFSIGNISFDTAGTGAIELQFVGVKRPYDIEKMIREKMIAK